MGAYLCSVLKRAKMCLLDMNPFSTSRSFRLSTGNMYFFSFSWKGNEEQVSPCSSGTSALPAWSISNTAPHQQRGILRSRSSVSLSLWEKGTSGNKSLSFPAAFLMWPNNPVPLTAPGPGTSTAMSNFPRLCSALQSHSSWQRGKSRFRKSQAGDREAGLKQKLSVNKPWCKILCKKSGFYICIYTQKYISILILLLYPITFLVLHS